MAIVISDGPDDKCADYWQPDLTGKLNNISVMTLLFQKKSSYCILT